MNAMEWTWLIPVLCFTAFPLIILFGRFLPGKGAFLSILAISLAFVLFCFVTLARVEEGATGTSLFSYKWFEAGNITFTWGVIVDPLTIVMLGLVTFVALMIQIYSLSYMKGDARFGWFFAVQSLFAGSMLAVILADNFLLLYVAWELVGLCSYLLIGFWYERRSAAEAAKKAFVTTRIADVALLVGILLLFREVGSFSMSTTFQEAGHLMAGEDSLLSNGTATVSALLIFVGAMGKSAQVPFHVWLPDAMEGPTPVSALIHAATMVVAGVFLVARAYPLFEAVPNVLIVVASIGLLTTLMAASMALVSTDLKRILAYSTVSHLGLMMLALGAFGYTAAIFHLMAHGFSKALLFLGAGSVMHGTNQTDIRKMGGLRKLMPMTALTFGIGALSLGGVPIFAGFWSKDEILLSVLNNRNIIFIILALVAVFLSAMYMARAFLVAFLGTVREENKQAHESPMAMLLPMILLAILAITFGFLALEWTTDYKGIGSFLFFDHPHEFTFNVGLGIISIMLTLAAFILAWMVYVTQSISLSNWKQRISPVIKVIEKGYFFDDVYQWTIDKVILVSSSFVALFDRVIINDLGVNGPANSIRRSAFSLRRHVTGKVYNYALAMMFGAIGIAVAWWAIGVNQ